MVHHRAVGDEGQRVGKVAVHKLVRVRPEEALRVQPAEKLHAHRVHLARFQGRRGVFRRDALAVHPVGKGVARLVGDHLHVALRAVEVGKDERDLVLQDVGAETAAHLALGGKHVKQSSVQHRAEKLAGFGRKRVVKRPALRQDVVRRAHGARVAAPEAQRGVRE